MSSPGFFDSPFLQGPEGYLLVENEQRLRNESYGVLALTWILLVTSWVTIVLRFYARGRVLRSIGYDDWTMLATVVSNDRSIRTLLHGLTSPVVLHSLRWVRHG